MKLAIFGCGKIAKRIAASCKLVEGLELAGFASRDIERAKEYSLNYGCRQYGDYEGFLDSDIENIYIATYNPGHPELIRKCLEHHKNVICEKPMFSSIAEAEELFALAQENDVLLMEALKSVFLPVIIRVKEMIDGGRLGKITGAYASFMRNGRHPSDHWINDPKTGGALKDLGTYCIGTLNYLFDGDPRVIKVDTDATAKRADTTALVDLEYGDVSARASMSNAIDGDNCLLIKGERGIVRVENYWKTGNGRAMIDNGYFSLEEECISDFYYEIKHFKELVEQNQKMSPVMSKQATIDILKVTDWKG